MTTLSPREANEARATALALRVQGFLALHGYQLELDQLPPRGLMGVWSRFPCRTCDCKCSAMDIRFSGKPGLWVHLDETENRWRVDIRRESDRHQTLFVRADERCPVLAFALAQLTQEASV